MAVHFTDENFKNEVIEKSKEMPVLVDFFAEWCGPCRMLAPIIEDTAKELEGKAVVGKVNTEEAPGLAKEYEVMSIPTILIFKGGEIVEQKVGLMPKEVLVSLLEKHM